MSCYGGCCSDMDFIKINMSKNIICVKKQKIFFFKVFSLLWFFAIVIGTLPACSQERIYYDANNAPNKILFDNREGTNISDALYNAILNCDNICDLSSFQITEKEFAEKYDIWRLLDENPAIAYIKNYTWQSVNGIVAEITFEYESIPSDYKILLEQAVDSAIGSIKENLQEDYLQAELVCAINDYIAIQCQYAFEPDGVTPDNNASGAYSALVDSRAVCDGYSNAFTLIAQQFGLDVKKISGLSEPGDNSHAWNLVKVDGQWYHVDVTWNDPIPDMPGKARHDYLLLSDGAISKQRDGSQQYHASWDADAPKANDARYEDAFWIYEDTAISFKTMHFDEWERKIAEISFEDVLKSAVENDAEANIARFGLDKEKFAAEMKKIYPNIGYSYAINSSGIVVSVGDWDK